jgi:small subunit ribosomal protein S16
LKVSRNELKMAVKIRFSRLGKKKHPYWRIVALEEKSKRDGAFLEDLGTYDAVKHQVVKFHVDRIKDWITKGALCSPAVIKLLRLHGAQAK